MIHINTNNTSFIDMHKYLADQGIRNNDFMLALNNPNLEYVDPYDVKDDDEWMAVFNECQENFWYFIREVLRWEDTSDNNLIYTKLDRGNMAMYWNSLNGVSSWRTHIRQSWSDMSVLSFMIWNFIFKPDMKMGVISDNNDSADIQLRKMREISNNLPEPMRAMANYLYMYSRDGKDHRYQKWCNVIKIRLNNKLIHNEIRRINSPISVVQADNIARGDSYKITFYHNTEFIRYLDRIIYAGASAKYHANGINIFNSIFTPPYISPTAKFAEAYIEELLKWKDIFYDMDPNEYKDVINGYSNGVVYIKHFYHELGRSEKQHEKMSSLISNPDVIIRELIPQRRI